jgi:flagellar biogenesis protein FliO
MIVPWKKAIPEVAVIVALASPATAWAEGAGGAPGLGELGLRAGAALAAVLALIAVLAVLVRRLRLSPHVGRSGGRLASRGRLELGGRREIRLIQVDRQMLIVGITPERIELLSAYDEGVSSTEIPSSEGEPDISVLRKLATSS